MSVKPFGPTESMTVSRREFFKSLGATAAASATTQVEGVAAELEKLNSEKTYGPAAVPIQLNVNGETVQLTVEPRVTLLEALRWHSHFTGAKEVCDRGTCGACTVLFDGRPIYACMKLALEAPGHAITTVEGLAVGGQLSRVQQAFIESDALMCGYCTPGFVLSVTALLERHPRPTAGDVRHACAGNLCRCGTYPRVLTAALKAAGVAVSNNTEVIRYGDLA
jgi:xanthine dehydrogenase YagT iron-sulfur-binding subunit